MSEKDAVPTAVKAPHPGLGPVAPQERIEVIDILRGWAIFGMIFVNMSVDLGSQGTTDRVAKHLVDFFASGKFSSVFSFLFGLGFALQMRRAEAGSGRFIPVYLRRMAILLLIGLLQQLLVGWTILDIYAVLGFVLLPFCSRSTRALALVALSCLLINPIRSAVVEGVYYLRVSNPQTAERASLEAAQREEQRRAQRQQSLRIHTHGTFRQIVAEHEQGMTAVYFSVDTYLRWLGSTFPLFLLGLYVGRRRIFENLSENLYFIRKVMWWGLGVGLVCTSAYYAVSQTSNPALPYLARPLATLLRAIGAPALGFCYAVGIIFLAQRDTWKTRLAPLGLLGRMALTNYLFHALVYSLVYNGYGLGLYERVGTLGGLALAALIFPLQVILSAFWMRRFRFGPVEWLWRTLTYGKLQPMRVQQPVAVNA